MLNRTPEQWETLHAQNDLRRVFPKQGMLTKLDTLIFSTYLEPVEKVAYLERLNKDISRFNVMGIIRELDTIIKIRADKAKNT